MARSTTPLVIALMAMAQPALAQETPAALIGNWQGTYVCAQGKTGLTLTIDRQDGSRFSGVFQFYPLRENITVPEGCFTVSGRIRGGGALDITGSKWIKRPAGYITVDLHGRVGQGGADLSGTVETPGYGKLCSTFELMRSTTKPSVDDTCRAEAPAVSSTPDGNGLSLAAGP
ncbi:MAG: hypothetical protein GY873_33180 [Bosea sp.]|uniref:hypothetical protein n=1 Tax=Bosea sp. (in: a-proteobacteria) TaxID=1871050 RepID=UPI002384C316|nr:hypothetical protein [Bosea sp. (in: a-proteobacteria)]MCP4739047.1 hypothetical protein [Bosea sp. (in: a-proteobacteria)]